MIYIFDRYEEIIKNKFVLFIQIIEDKGILSIHNNIHKLFHQII